MSIVFQCSPVVRKPRLDRETYCNQCGEIIFAKATALRVVTLDCEPYMGFAWYYICNLCEWAWPPERERTPPPSLEARARSPQDMAWSSGVRASATAVRAAT